MATTGLAIDHRRTLRSAEVMHFAAAEPPLARGEEDEARLLQLAVAEPGDASRTEVVVDQPQRPLPPGWMELVLDGVRLNRPLHAKLLTTYVGGEEARVEYALSPVGGRRHRIVLHSAKPILRARLLPAHGSAHPEVARARLIVLSRPNLLLRALQRAPVTAITAAYWRLLGKKLRARNRLRRILCCPASIEYQAWLEVHEPRWAAEVSALLARLSTAGPPVRVGVLVALAQGEQLSRRTVQSLAAQEGVAWRLVVLAPEGAAQATAARCLAAGRCAVLHPPSAASRAERLNIGLAALDADWVVVLGNGDSLAAGALARVADAGMLRPDCAAIYGDHDFVAGNGQRYDPCFKPAWNLPYFLAYDYIDTVFFRRSRIADHRFRSAYTALEADDLLLRLAAASGPSCILHLPRVLHHRRGEEACPARDSPRAATRRALVQGHLMPADPRPTVLRDALGHIRVIAPLPATLPLVTVIIPTRDRVHLLRPCVEGVCRAEYANLEILIVDNASQCRKTRRYLAAVLGDRRISILALPGSFNFAALNNAAVRVARGQILAFLNNDVQCMETGWLMEMVSHAVRPEIGAVGAKLLYPEGSVQHAGVILGLGGLAGHAHRFFPADHLGYMRRLQTAQYVSAVTAACMVLERKKFTEVGGFDEKTFSVAYNDVDLCLKLRSRGYENFYTPYATLYHKESASRARDISRARRSAYARESHSFKARWQHMLATDPYYNPNLTLEKEDFSLR